MGGEIAPADLAAFIRGELRDEENSLRHLPAAQTFPAKLEERRFLGPARGHDAGGDLFVSRDRGAPENNSLAHPRKGEEVCFDFRRVHFFSGDVDHVGKPADEEHAVGVQFNEIVRAKNARAEF